MGRWRGSLNPGRLGLLSTPPLPPPSHPRRAAEKINAGLIIVMVQSGRTVSLVAKYRPPMPIMVRWPAGLGWQGGRAAVPPARHAQASLAAGAGLTTPPACLPHPPHPPQSNRTSRCRPWWCRSSSRLAWAGSWRVRVCRALGAAERSSGLHPVLAGLCSLRTAMLSPPSLPDPLPACPPPRTRQVPGTADVHPARRGPHDGGTHERRQRWVPCAATKRTLGCACVRMRARERDGAVLQRPSHQTCTCVSCSVI